jgi:hypothetical protein
VKADGTAAAAGQLEASAVSGQVPPAGPQWLRGLRALEPSGLAYDKPLCASLDGFTLHAATRAGARDTAGREALLRYVLRPPVAQERIEPQKDGLVAITLKRAYADGTVAVVMDPLSLLCRLAMSVPPPRYHIVKYAGVLASASRLRSRIAPVPAVVAAQGDDGEAVVPERRGTYRPWAELPRAPLVEERRPAPKVARRRRVETLEHRLPPKDRGSVVRVSPRRDFGSISRRNPTTKPTVQALPVCDADALPELSGRAAPGPLLPVSA